MRVILSGFGEPDQVEALPDLTQFGDSVTVQLADGELFHKADYETFGFTHYETWCIGAVGGDGGGGLGISWYYWFSPMPGYPFRVHWLAELDSLGQAGGSGGGGGLHVVSGALADLDDDVLATVGQPGENGADGQVGQLGAWTDPEGHPPWGSVQPANHVWEEPHAGPGNPAHGGDGGYSSFGTICQASGGKGGKRAADNFGPSWTRNGAGGDGGLGGTLVAGGGGAGAPSLDILPGSNGGWDGTIGGGGGGGRAGYSVPFFGGWDSPGAFNQVWATKGGNGAFSYADTSVFGVGQAKNDAERHIYVPGWSEYWITQTGNWSSSDGLNDSVLPDKRGGNGGGAHKGNLKFGSRAYGYSPEGLVAVRLFKAA